MPYREINHNYLYHPFITEIYKHFNISYGKHIVKIEPYNKVAFLQYLVTADETSQGIKIPKAILEKADIGKRVYEEVIDGTSYLMSDSFVGNPQTAKFILEPAFPRRKFPKEAFFKEAATATPVVCSCKRHNIYIPKALKSKLPLPKNAPYIIITLFSSGECMWAEIRIDNPAITINEGRVSSDYIFPELSGITFRAKMHSDGGIKSSFVRLGADPNQYLVGWYSRIRRAIILEKPPVHCAVCGSQIRWTNPTHTHVSVASTHIADLGPGNNIHTLIKGEQLLEKCKEHM